MPSERAKKGKKQASKSTSKKAPAKKHPPSSKASAKKKVASSSSRKSNPTISLSEVEVVFLRDLFGVQVFSQDDDTVVGLLSKETTGGSIVEERLWQKITKLCEKFDIPLGSGAPDYVVIPVGPAPLGLFKLEHDDAPQDVSELVEDNDDDGEEESEE